MKKINRKREMSLVLQGKKWAKLCCIIFILTAAFVTSSQNLRGLFVSDEVDYKKAIDKGFLENWIEQHSISIKSLVQQVMTDVVTKGDIDVWQLMDKKEDVLAYRHFHAPFAFHYFILAKYLSDSSEFAQRSAALFITLLFTLAFFLLPLSLLAVSGFFGQFFATLFFVLSTVFVYTSTTISPHMLFLLVGFLALYFSSRFLMTSQVRYFYLSCGLIGLSFATLEYAPILLLAVLISFLMVPNKIFSIHHQNFIVSAYALYGAIIGLFIFFVIWPAGILKLKVLICYGDYLYNALLTSYYGDPVSHLQSLLRIFGNIPRLVLIPSGIIVFVYLLVRKKIPMHLLPFFIFGLSMFCINFKNHFVYPQYILSFLPYLLFLWGVAFQYLWNRSFGIARTALFSIALAVLLGSVEPCVQASSQMLKYSNRVTSQLKELQKYIKPTDRVLVIGAEPVFTSTQHFPASEISRFYGESDSLNNETAMIEEKQYGFILANKQKTDFYKKIAGQDRLLHSIQTNYHLVYRDDSIALYQVNAIDLEPPPPASNNSGVGKGDLHTT